MLGSTNMEMNIINDTIATANGPEYIVRELLGQEKSKLLRHPVNGNHYFVA